MGKNKIISDGYDCLLQIQGGGFTTEDGGRGTGYVYILRQKYKFALYGENHTQFTSSSTIYEYTLIAEEALNAKTITKDIVLNF